MLIFFRRLFWDYFFMVWVGLYSNSNQLFYAEYYTIQPNKQSKTSNQMHKKPTQQKDKTVELKQLVSQPQCLKLLILHTPFNLNIDSLHQCINLVKLDLSKNNLSSFPYLGDLPSLRFMFIHQNKLDIDSLIGIFQESVGKETRSALSKSVIWVTYWGNRSQFNARHYLVNHTSVLAVDHHMVVPEEKSEFIFVQKKFVQPFDPMTDISEIFHNRKKFNKNATQQEYMAQFWEDMAEIRRKHVEINLVIKIQRLYRGWIYRLKQTRAKAEKQENKVVLQKVFKAWRRQSKFTKKLRLIFKKFNKQYMLLPLKQMKLEAAKRKIIEYVQNVKKKIILRKMSLKSEYKFYNVLKSNQQALRSLYNILHIDRSQYIMVHVEAIEEFKKYVVPVASSMNGGVEVLIQENTNISLRNLYQPPRKRRQFLRLLQINQKSIVTEQNLQKSPKKPLYNYTVYKLQQSNLTNIYNSKNIHFSQTQKQKMQNIDKSLNYKKNMDLGELKKVCGSKQLLKDIVRGVYFYNMGYLTNCDVPTHKIDILSDYSIKKMTAILKIQKVWRGISFRRKIMRTAKANYRISRAAVKIQRWFRNLQWNHRKIFMFDMCQFLRNFNSDSFYIKMSEYMQLLQLLNKDNTDRYERMTFPQQNIIPFISKQTKKLLISWDSQARNQSTFINHRMGKRLFTEQFINKVFDKWPFAGPVKLGEDKNYDRCQISHVFHYRTQISLVNRKNGQYMEIKCGSKYDCRLRILTLKLLTYNFNHKQSISILPSQSVSFYQSQLSLKKTIKNPSSIFISQTSSQFQIQAVNNENTKNYEYYSKFYISEANQKPIKFATNLKIILIDIEQKQNEERKKRSISYNQDKFDVSSFLIAETNDVKIDHHSRQVSINQQILPLAAKMKKESLKNLKVEKKLKAKNRDKVHSLHTENKQFNFMLGDPHFQERLTTQPDLLTHQRSMASLVAQTDMKKKQISKSDVKVIESRALIRKRVGINNQSSKAHSKNIEEFTKNFINQGNFIQSQFLYGQIKRLKTQIERNSVDQAGRIKTEQKQISKYLQKFKEQKLKRAHEAHQKHKQEQYRSVIEKRSDLQTKIKQKSQNKQANYKSLPRKIRINFAEECYPIIGKYPVGYSNKKQE